MSVFGGYPVPETNAKSKALDSRFAVNVHPASVAATGSGTITMPIFTSDDTNANRLGSPLRGMEVNSIGSSGFLGSPHCSLVLPAHMSTPSFPMDIPSKRADGFSALTGQSIYLNRVFAGIPVTKTWYLTTKFFPDSPDRETSFASIEVPGGTICSNPTSMFIRL